MARKKASGWTYFSWGATGAILIWAVYNYRQKRAAKERADAEMARAREAYERAYGMPELPQP